MVPVHHRKIKDHINTLLVIRINKGFHDVFFPWGIGHRIFGVFAWPQAKTVVVLRSNGHIPCPHLFGNGRPFCGLKIYGVKLVDERVVSRFRDTVPGTDPFGSAVILFAVPLATWYGI
ncbi:hypothetical protein D3C86_1704430 [compost metagenome]